MSVIKKEIKIALCKEFVSGGTHYILVPDLTKFYNIKIGLYQDTKDLGYFSVFEVSSNEDNNTEIN